jgi:hypothetical protein
MKQVAMQVKSWDARRIERTVETVLREFGLQQSLKGTLGTYRGCLHWHFKKPRISGTLEVTAWPVKKRLWFSVQSGRVADWINAELPGIHKAVAQALRAPASADKSRKD